MTIECRLGIKRIIRMFVSVDSFEQEAKSKQEKNAEIKKLTAEIGTMKR